MRRHFVRTKFIDSESVVTSQERIYAYLRDEEPLYKLFFNLHALEPRLQILENLTEEKSYGDNIVPKQWWFVEKL